jgi:hypothetical protein
MFSKRNGNVILKSFPCSSIIINLILGDNLETETLKIDNCYKRLMIVLFYSYEKGTHYSST